MTGKMRPEDRVTEAILHQLEAGVRPWTQPWAGGGGITLPVRVTGEPYRGVNVIMLWIRSVSAGFRGDRWMTYNQAKALGAQVRKGETGAYIVKYGQTPIENEDGEERFRPFLRGYTVFNTDQIDGLPADLATPPAPPLNTNPDLAWDTALEDVLSRTGTDVSWTGNSAYYSPKPDHIRMPARELFRDTEQAYSTLLHELVHWTGHEARLNRDFRNTRDAYAREELVAELGAAFLGAHFGFRPDHIEDHAAYLDHWITVLRSDSRAILQAASKAQAACDHILLLVADRPDVGEAAAA
jgi:antirestriction protein ArdC